MSANGSPRPQRQAPRPPGSPRMSPRETPVQPLDEGVRRILSIVGLSRYEPYFQAEEIDLAAMLLMNDEDIEDMLVREKSLFVALLRSVKTSSVSPGPTAPQLTSEQATQVAAILHETGETEAWASVDRFVKQLELKLARCASVYESALQRMTLESNAGVSKKVLEGIFYRHSILHSLAGEFRETHDSQSGAALLGLLQSYARNLEDASVALWNLQRESRRVRLTLEDIARDSVADGSLEHLLEYPLVVILALEEPLARLDAQGLGSQAQAMQEEAHATGRRLASQHESRKLARRLGAASDMGALLGSAGPLVQVGRAGRTLGRLRVERGSRCETVIGFLWSDLLILTSESLRVLAALQWVGQGPANVEQLADGGLRVRNATAWDLGNGLSEDNFRLYPLTPSENHQWLEAMQQLRLVDPPAAPRSPRSPRALLAKLARANKGTSPKSSPRGSSRNNE